MSGKNYESGFREVREFYGLTQLEFARYLGVSRSRLSMAEIRKRSLDEDAYIKLGKLATAMYSQQAAPDLKASTAIAAEQKQKRDKVAKAKLSDNNYWLETAKKDLAKMKAEHIRALAARQSLQILEGVLNPLGADLLGTMQSNAKKTYEQSGEDAQLKLELLIAGIEAELGFLKKNFKHLVS